MRLDQAEPAAVPLRVPAGSRLNPKSGLLSVASSTRVA
jgi:hypothetical protein